MTNTDNTTPLEEEQYKIQLINSIAEARQGLINYIRSLEYDVSQQGIRRLSWTHSLFYNNVVDYRHKCDELLGNFILPLHIGTSTQDAYHHSHFIKACLCAILYRPKEEAICPEPYNTQTKPLCAKRLDNEELFRLELQERVYHTLWDVIPKSPPTPSTPYTTIIPKVKPNVLETLNEMNEKLERILTIILQGGEHADVKKTNQD